MKTLIEKSPGCRDAKWPKISLWPLGHASWLAVLFLQLALYALLLTATSASAATRYVWQNSPSPAPPYTSWGTAAQVIQDTMETGGPG